MDRTDNHITTSGALCGDQGLMHRPAHDLIHELRAAAALTGETGTGLAACGPQPGATIGHPVRPSTQQTKSSAG